MVFPLGTHRVRPIDCVLGMTGTGKEQIGVMLEHVETGERITWYGYFTEGTFERTINSLRYMGWQGSDLAELRQGLPDGMDKEVDAVIEDEEDQRDGRMRRKVQWINSGMGVAVKDPLDEGAARAFSARMKARVIQLQQKGGAAKPAPAKAKPVAKNAAGQSVYADDIPF